MPSDPIIWANLNTNERDALVAGHVFGRKVIAWKPGRDLLMERKENPRLSEAIPAYTESMDAAWKVLQRLQEICEAAHGTGRDVFLSELGFHRIAWFDPNAPVMFTLKDLVAITPEMICIVALRSLGLIIDTVTERTVEEVQVKHIKVDLS